MTKMTKVNQVVMVWQ